MSFTLKNVSRERYVISMSAFYTQERKSKVNKDIALDKGMTLQWQGGRGKEVN